MMAAAANTPSKMNGRVRGLGPDGLPRLPPIQKPKTAEDPYAKSKLMKFRMAKHKEDLLKKIMHENAMKVYQDTLDITSQQPPKEDEPAFPKEMMSEERGIRLNYQFLKKCVESAPTTPMQQSWFDNILSLIPESLKNERDLKEVITELFEEIRTDFESSMKKSMVQQTLVKPNVKGLEDDDTGPPPEEPTGVDYSSPWHDNYVANKVEIKDNLHILHPSMQVILNMCQQTLGPILLCDCSGYRVQGPMEFEHLRNNVILDCERTEEKLTSSWLPAVINVFTDKTVLQGMKSDKVDSFYNCVTTLISNQLKDLLVRTIEAWVFLFDESNREHLPIFKMELTFDDQRMQFYPTYEDLEELVLFVVEHITSTLQQVPTVQSWLAGTSSTVSTDAKVADHIVEAARTKLKEAVSRNFEEPKAHLQWFMDQYSWIVNGEAMKQIEAYMAEEHTFEEYTEYIEKFRSLSKEIMGLPSIEHYDMIRLDCEDLKRGLSDAANDLAQVLLVRVVTDHRKENQSICSEFTTMKERALKEPETSEELMDMVSFIETARTMGMIKLNERIKESQNRMQYLLEAFFFETDDIELNKEVLVWPQKINPVFDQNDELVESSKQSGEKALIEKKEKVMLELQKLKTRVDEFNDYGELDMMQQYVQDVRTVQRRLADAQEQITWINKEEALYKYPISTYPEVDEVSTGVDPFMRLFMVVSKWQRAEKKWMDGSFNDLDAEAIDAEVDDYWRELYKIQKVFNNKLKKLQLEKDERDRERKKKKVPTATLR